MSDKLNALGVPPEFHGHAKHFIGVFKNLGWSPSQIDEAIRWGVNFNGTPDERFSHFANFAEQQGISETDIGIAASWRDQVSEQGGVENMPQPPAQATSPQADAARRHEIELDMKRPKSDSEYWRSPDVRDEYRELLERAGPDRGEYVPGPTGNDTARKAEIEALMRSDRAAYHRTNADREYLEIVQREMPEVVESASAQPNTEED